MILFFFSFFFKEIKLDAENDFGRMQSRHDFVFYSTGVKGKNSGTPALEKKKENIRERERERERLCV
jgi:hypothetical protein